MRGFIITIVYSVINTVEDSRQAEIYVITFIVEFLGTLLNGLLAIGILIVLPLIMHIENERIAEAEYRYLCSQSRHIVGYSEGNGIYMKTPYVYCNEDLEGGHNFIRVPHVEKKYFVTLRRDSI